MDIVLVHPMIPWNTGNVARTCVATQTHLHIVKPIGFDLSDRKLKRAGLDYWANLTWTLHDNLKIFLETFKHRPKFFFSRFASQTYWDASYPSDAMMIFGSETQGLPSSCKDQYPDDFYVIPSPGEVRSLNLSTSAAIVLFEAIRQNK